MLKNLPRFEKNLPRFWENVGRFWKTPDVFIGCLEKNESHFREPF